ncbi:MAG: PP2C family protein-serine/threonine phosphatase [bacterium]
MKARKKSKWESLKEFYQLYTSGLNRSEVERLLKRDTVDVFSYYKRGIRSTKKVIAQDKFPKKQLQVAKDIFLSFLMKLTPARRFFYGIAFVLFILALGVSNWSYALFVFLILNFLLALELADKLVAKDELEIARDIQISLQPEKMPHIKGLDISTYYQPAKEVGGDYYDLIKIDDHKLVVIVGDVSGKGMPAALYAVKLQGLVELLAKNRNSPKQILEEINEIITHRLKKQFFITAVVAIFDLKEKTLRLARAGHNPPMYFKSLTNQAVWLNPKGIGIGLEKNPNFKSKLNEKVVSVTPGDLFVFYTDGVTEVMNGAKVEFGEIRLGKFVIENAHLDVELFKEKLVEKLKGFAQKALLDDDATVVVVKVRN